MVWLLLLPVLLWAYFYGVRVGYRAGIVKGHQVGVDDALRAVRV